MALSSACTGRVDIATAARVSVLSTRWKHLPWLLCELTIDVKDFLSAPPPNPIIEAAQMDEAMTSLTKVTRSFLVAPRTESTITRLQLKLYLINNYACDIGPLVSEAIDTGILTDLDLAVLDENEIADCTNEQMLQQARVMNGFFTAYPSVLHCLARLSLYNLCFVEWDMHHLFDCCKQLRHLSLSNCDAGLGSQALYGNAPDSKLSVFELDFCCLGGLEVLCLLKLQRLHWDTWLYLYAPYHLMLSCLLRNYTSHVPQQKIIKDLC